ncbi:serine hydrolase [Clostridium paraputrificum]|uniref:serine hydrolase n=1 Tax=Clostridium TaxID=1485 RepID=UPI003D324CF0
MKNYRLLNRLFSFIFIFTFLTSTMDGLNANAASSPPSLNSEGVVLMDGSSGEVLYSKNGDTQYFPASTTKIITAQIVLEHTKLDDKVTVGKNPPFADGTSIGLKEGEIYTVRELLAGLLLESGNDCAEALAEHVSGSIEEFSKLMNERAREIGAVNSNFTNPSGLPDKNHVTTPKDLALFMKEAVKNKDFVEISKISALELPPSNLDGSIRHVNNHNYILLPNSSYYYPFAVASKKGYTVAAKFTNVISAEKNGHTLIASFLKGEGISQVYSDVAKIFDYGFENFARTKIYSEGEEVGSFKVNEELTVPLLAAKDIYYTTKIGDNSKLNVSLEYETPTNLATKAFNRGDILTTAKVLIDGKEVDSINLASGITREYTSTLAINSFFEDNKTNIGIFIFLFLLFILYIRSHNRKKRRRRKFQQKLQKAGNPNNNYKLKKP